MNATSPRVIILGAGPVGLAAAVERARFGVPSIVIEKHPGTSWHPKTRNFATRTMEIARGWGRPVYERLRAIDTPDGWKTPIRFLESATGEEFGSIESTGFMGPGPHVSPALPIMSSQERIEAILVDAALASGLVVEETPDRYRFPHDIVRRTLVAQLSGARRRSHARRLRGVRARGCDR